VGIIYVDNGGTLTASGIGSFITSGAYSNVIIPVSVFRPHEVIAMVAFYGMAINTVFTPCLAFYCHYVLMVNDVFTSFACGEPVIIAILTVMLIIWAAEDVVTAHFLSALQAFNQPSFLGDVDGHW